MKMLSQNISVLFLDTPGSEVHGAVLDGHFKGSVELPGQDTLYIEPNTNKSDDHHSILYTHRDLKR